MTGFHWDTSEINQLAGNFSEAPGRLQRKAPGVFARGAFEIKSRVKRAASGHRNLPSLDRHVSYDKLGLLHYEIGFDVRGQGSLAGIAIDGSINNSPVMESVPLIARRELPEIERHLGVAGEEAVFGGGSR